MRHNRRPPMPTGLRDRECPWCGVLAAVKRGYWHPACVTAYRIAAFSADQRSAVRARDAGRCAVCGTTAVRWGWKRGRERYYFDSIEYDGPYVPVWPARVDDWDADHIKPLWSAPADLRLADRDVWFSLANLQTLCRPCHKAKTTTEAGRRAGKPQLELICEAA